MNKSESIKNLSAALAKFHGLVGKIKKDAKNPFFKSTYASLANILDGIQSPLQESGLVFSQFPTDQNGLSTVLIHAESGEWMESTYIMPVAKQNDPQAVGSAITYARRYALASILGLNIDEDDDGNAAAQKPKQPDMKQVEAEVQACLTKEALAKVWDKYHQLQGNAQFKTLMTTQKEKL